MPNDWDKDQAIAWLHKNITTSITSHHCARTIRQAIQAGGIKIGQTQDAKNYGPFLKLSGFQELPDSSTPQAGDIAVIQSTRNNTYGHMCMFDGRIWISDFNQARGMYPGPEYRNERPSFKIYHHR